MCYVPESPKFLFSNGKYDECRAVLCRIAKTNNYSNRGALYVDEITNSRFRNELEGQKVPNTRESEVNDKQVTVIGDEVENKASLLCTDSTLRSNLIVLIIMWMTAAYAYYLIAFELKYLNDDIYTNSLITVAAEIIGKLLAGVFIDKIGLKPTFMISLFLALVGCLLMILFQGKEGKDYLMWIFIMITRFGASIEIVGASVGTVLIMPTQLVTTAMGISNAFARTLAMLAPLITEIA